MPTRQYFFRKAFTLVELIVVVLIAVFLLLLLLPGLQNIRESSRRATCSKNLAEIGAAVEQYHDSYGRLPVGDHMTGHRGPDFGNGSVLVHLLPYLNRSELFEALEIGQGQRVDFQTLRDGTPIGSVIVGVYVCPSANNRGVRGYNSESRNKTGFAVANYAATMGPTELVANPDRPCSRVDEWNSLALGKNNPDEFAGSFFRNPRYRLTFDDILDGRDSTIFFGEVRGECSWHIQRGWCSTDNGQGSISTVVPINWDSSDPNATDGCYHPASGTGELGFKSMHPDGVNLLMGGGSVQFIDEKIDMETLQRMGGRSDGMRQPE